MEFEEAHKNLRAIRLLYSLLHNNTVQLQHQFSDDLIERARGLLKSLLDVAVIITTQANVSETTLDQGKDVTPHKEEELQKKLISEIEEKGSISNNRGKNNPIQISLCEKIDLVSATTTMPIEYSKESTGEDHHNNGDESYKNKNIPLLSTIDELQYNPSDTGHVESSNQKDFCDDLLSAMKRIESRMFALQLCSNLVSSTKNSADKQNIPQVTNLDMPHVDAVYPKSNDIPKQISSQLVFREEESRSQGKIQPPTQKFPMTNRVNSLNQNDVTKKPLTGHRNGENVVRNNPVTRSEADQNHEKKSLEHSYRHLPVKSTASSIARKQPQPHQMVIRPTLLDQRYSGIKVFSHKNREGSALHRKGSHKERDEPQDKDDDEVEESSSNDYQSSSSWTSQEVRSANGSGGNSSEDHSLQGETEVSTSGTMVDASYEYSSEECDNNSYTSNDNYNSLNSSDSLKSHRYYNKIKPEKKVGGLRRLKNKLGLIFHHHHHHHHYHHDNDDNYDDDGSIDSKRRQRHSMWSNLQNVFHHKNKHHGMITNGSDEKPRRGSAVARVTHRNQVGQFHRLVEGLMGHIRHAKKPKKPHKVAVKGSRNAPHGHRKKNPNWWKMLQQHRGVKVKNRGRVRKEFIGQKSPKKLT
ncbi:putative serine/threonine-protein kinase [Arachis hypogaea]|uniref:Uncharacterized protein n=2 Tax=Arachis TaxID=3817 RepID=A0A444YYK9_ARAHY|nr:putative serine/threonine-protein kinase [Arachis hypogaea]RYR07020.1 hypothetical protein Ahy_B05g074341 [Arachis hypogaea]